MAVAPAVQEGDTEMQQDEPAEPSPVLPDDVKAEVEETQQTCVYLTDFIFIMI